jgi:hypothetical protein
MKLKNLFYALLLTSITIVACHDDHDHEQENINTVRLVIRDVVSSGLGTTYAWTDPDGAGGNAPRIDSIRLDSNKTYTVEARFLDASTTVEKDYTDEIKAENTAHLVVWTINGANVTVSNKSTDSNGKDFAQTANLTTTRRSNGTLNVILKHNPDKNATNPALTGETDVEVTFPLVVK